MLVETLSTFPDMFSSVMGTSIMKRAQDKGILRFRAHDLRDWTHDRHRTTDDYPFGGGQGLVMKCEPIFEAFDDIAAGRGPAADAAAAGEGGSDGCAAADGALGARDAADELGEGGATGGASRSAAGGLNEGGAAGDASRDPLLSRPYTIFLTPVGEQFSEALALDLAQQERLLFVCGHYEGIDERAYCLADRCISLGDYVLTSGELAAMVVIDAVVRKLPGVLGDEGSAVDESFYDNLLEYPQYTRPAEYCGMRVPDVLLSGNHAEIDKWRRHMSLERTARLRPDLLDSANLSDADRAFLSTLR